MKLTEMTIPSLLLVSKLGASLVSRNVTRAMVMMVLELYTLLFAAKASYFLGDTHYLYYVIHFSWFFCQQPHRFILLFYYCLGRDIKN